jgi:hypothetical protein
MLSDLHPQRIFTNEYIHIELDKNLGYIATEWLQHPSSEEFRRYMMLGATLIKEHRCQYCLSDARKVFYIEAADQSWLVREIIPLVVSSARKVARIMTKDGLAMMDMQSVLGKVSEEKTLASKIEIEVFLDKESALEWLFKEQAG